MKYILITILAAIVGEAALAILTTIAQEVIVDGVHVHSSSLSTLVIGGFATLLAALFSGLLATWVGGRKNPWPIVIVSCLVIIETSYLLLNERFNNPVWFAVLSALALISFLWIGYYLYRLVRK